MFKKNILLLLFIFIFLGCYEHGLKGSGILTSDERALPVFNEIKLGGAYKVNIFFDKEYKIKLSGDDNILPYATTNVQGKILQIDTDKKYRSQRDITLNIYTPSLEKISLSGAGTVNVPGLNTESFITETSGAGNINLSGYVKYLTISLSGTGKVDAKKLNTYNAKVRISGAGSVDINTENELDATLSGVGSINYYGEPKSIKKNISGIGSIKKRD